VLNPLTPKDGIFKTFYDFLKMMNLIVIYNDEYFKVLGQTFYHEKPFCDFKVQCGFPNLLFPDRQFPDYQFPDLEENGTYSLTSHFPDLVT
jgi:hypothetical protein